MKRSWYWAVVCVIGPALLAPAARADEYVWKDGKWVPAVKPAAGTPMGELAAIRELVEARQRSKAVAAVEKLLRKYSADPVREEAMALAGQAELDDGRYWQAYEWFERQLDEFPQGQYLQRALTREKEVAEAFLAGKKRIVLKVFRMPAKDEGLEILTRIAEHAPGSAIAEEALLRIGEYHYANGEYVEAADAYDNYLQLFPKSARAPAAMLQGARAMFASYKGIRYDETPLIEADQRFRMLARQFPAAAYKAKVEDVLKQIESIRAQKAYETAEFYVRTGRPTAAKFYYKQVVETYPASQWAEPSRRALGGVTAPAAPQPAGTSAPAPGPSAPAKAGPTTRPASGAGPVNLEKLATDRSKGGQKP